MARRKRDPLPPDPDAAAFLDAIRADPDELLNWMAYADHLAGRDDPRGEFMQVQLALERAGLPDPDRRELRRRERALLREHRSRWAGPLAADRWARVTFTRGWPTGVEMMASASELRALAAAPELRLLLDLGLDLIGLPVDEHTRRFVFGEPVPAWDAGEGLRALAGCPQLPCLRSFRFSCPPGTTGVGKALPRAVARMARLRELRVAAEDPGVGALLALPLPRLEVLDLAGDVLHPLDALVTNPSLGGLRTLRLECRCIGSDWSQAGEAVIRALCRSPHLAGLAELRLANINLGEGGAAALASSGVLRPLRALGLVEALLSDEDAAVLAACPDLDHLDRLDVTHNWLTGEGVRLLRENWANADVSAQWLA